MVIPFGATEVAHLVDQGLEPVVHGLWLLSLVEHESTELNLDCFYFGDLGHLISFVRGLEYVPNFFGALQPLLGLCFVAEGLVGRSGFRLKLFVWDGRRFLFMKLRYYKPT